MRELLRFAASIVLCEGVGIVSGLFTARGISEWYAHIAKPSFTPPDSVFGPVWTVLYFMMGCALYLVWRRWDGSGTLKAALAVFIAQLLLNGLWSFLFFGLRSPLAGMIEIVALWAAVIATTVLFWRISRPAGLLLVPYAAWVTFASVLNWSLWRLNS
jgi:tryptophan-rich sensory protein